MVKIILINDDVHARIEKFTNQRYRSTLYNVTLKTAIGMLKGKVGT